MTFQLSCASPGLILLGTVCAKSLHRYPVLCTRNSWQHIHSFHQLVTAPVNANCFAWRGRDRSCGIVAERSRQPRGIPLPDPVIRI